MSDDTTSYAVGVDTLFAIEASSPDEAEAELARRINAGEIEIDGDGCMTYDVYPEVDDDE